MHAQESGPKGTQQTLLLPFYVGPWGCSGCTLGVYKYLYKVAFEYPLVAPSSGVALVRHPKTTRLCVSVA